MEGSLIGSGASMPTAAASLQSWTLFLKHALATRLELDKFASFVPLLQSSNPLPPVAVADLFLRPTPSNRDTPDPRIQHYMQALLDLRYIDAPAILRALYRYSTSHTQAGAHHKADQPVSKGEASGDGHTQKQQQREVLRWTSSYAHEEVIFYRLTDLLTKPVAQATAMGTRDSLDVVVLMAKWMKLFTAANTAFTEDELGQLHGSQSRAEMESARAAFVMLLLGVCENKVVLQALSRPSSKGRVGLQCPVLL